MADEIETRPIVERIQMLGERRGKPNAVAAGLAVHVAELTGPGGPTRAWQARRQPRPAGRLGVRHLVAVAATLAISPVLAACGSGDGNVETGAPQSGSTPTKEKKVNQGQIVESGFGQSGQYVWVTALVKNLSDHGGQTVTVNFNLLDKNGKIVSSESQVESFDSANQLRAVGTQVDVGQRVKIASVQPTLLVKDEGTFEETKTQFGTFKAESITNEQYTKTQWHAKFTIKNPIDEALQSPRIGIICKGADGKVNGGGSDFPNLVPPSGQVVIDPHLITTGKPTACTAYVAAGM